MRAGSLLGLRLSNVSFPVGKVDWLHLYTMSFGEFLQGTEEKMLHDFLVQPTLGDDLPEAIHAKLWDLLKIYFVIGGLPESINTYILYKDNLVHAFDQVRQKQQTLIMDYDYGTYKGYFAENFIAVALASEPLFAWKEGEAQNTSLSTVFGISIPVFP